MEPGELRLQAADSIGLRHLAEELLELPPGFLITRKDVAS